MLRIAKVVGTNPALPERLMSLAIPELEIFSRREQLRASLGGLLMPRLSLHLRQLACDPDPRP